MLFLSVEARKNMFFSFVKTNQKSFQNGFFELIFKTLFSKKPSKDPHLYMGMNRFLFRWSVFMESSLVHVIYPQVTWVADEDRIISLGCITSAIGLTKLLRKQHKVEQIESFMRKR